jgi:hypothetical protein
VHQLVQKPEAERGVASHDWLGAAYLPVAAEVRRILVTVASLIVVVGCAREWLRLSYQVEGTSFFNLNREQNIGAWFSTLMLAGCALLLVTAGRRAVALKQPRAFFWFVLSATFVALSIDEASSIHESLMVPIHDALHSDGVFRYAWVVPALVLVPLFGFISAPFLFSLPRRTALRFFGAGAIYVTGALGFEMLEGLTDGVGAVFVTCYIVEETLEIVGILSFFFSLMDFLAAAPPFCPLEFPVE